jgi:hypothetical protein
MQGEAFAATEGTGGNVGAVWIEAESDARIDARADIVSLDGCAPQPGAAVAVTTRSRGWRLGDLSALVAVAQLWSEAQEQLAEDEANLYRTYGPRWPLVPRHHGGLATQANDILTTGIVPVRTDGADAVILLQQLESFVTYTKDIATHVREKTSLLGEGLGTDLTGLSLGQLRRVSVAVLRLADTPPPNPAWCRPAAARAAAVALAAFGEEIRAAGAVHHHLYEEFTDEVWDVSAVRSQTDTDRWWRLAARRRARAELTEVSRTGRPPADVKATMATLRRASALRDDVDSSWSSLRGHLGWFADTRLPDADGAAHSLAAIQELNDALGDRVNVEQLIELAAADAFVCEELTGPGDAIADAVAAWSGLARRFNGPDPLAFTAPELGQWAIVTAQSLEVVRVLKETTASLRPSVRTVDQLFDDAVARDRVAQLRSLFGLEPAEESAG